MGIHVLSYLRHTWRKKDRARDADWDFGARQAPDAASSARATPRRRSSSLSNPHPHPLTEKRVSAAVRRQGGTQDGRDPADVTPSRVGDGDAREDKPPGPAKALSEENGVLVAAGEFAKESRGIVDNGEKRVNRRRCVHSIAPARLTDSTAHLTLRHTNSAYMTRDYQPSPMRPLIQPQSARHTLIVTKRSLPQLHNVWENFLEETSEDIESFDLPDVSRRNSRSTKHASVRKGSDLGRPVSQQPKLVRPILQRHMHTPSRSSMSSIKQFPNPALGELAQSPPSLHSHSCPTHSRLRTRGYARASHHTSSSTSSLSGSTSSLAFSLDISSVSSMNTVCDGDNPGAKHENFQGGDDLADLTPPVKLDEHADYCLTSPRLHVLRDRASASFYSHHLSHAMSSSTPSSREDTPTPTTASLPRTPPSSRSSSRSSPVYADRGTPSPRRSGPEDLNLIREAPIVQTKSNTFPCAAAPRSLPDACADTDVSGDVLSELEYYCGDGGAPRRPYSPTVAASSHSHAHAHSHSFPHSNCQARPQSQTQQQQPSGAIHAPPSRRSSRQNLANLRAEAKSKSVSNLGGLAAAYAQGHHLQQQQQHRERGLSLSASGGNAGSLGESGNSRADADEFGVDRRYEREYNPYCPDQWTLDDLPPQHPGRLQPKRTGVRGSMCGYDPFARELPTGLAVPTSPPSMLPPTMHPLHVKKVTPRAQTARAGTGKPRSTPTPSNAGTYAVQWGYAV